jgi:nitrogen fixation/metabolism regulation signal transduction histidine kinase
MFKSIQYRLLFCSTLLILAVALAVWAFLSQYYFLAAAGTALTVAALFGLNDCYRRYNTNIFFLLNALDNGDYSFNFSENKQSRREKEMNQMLNRIKDILTNARKEVIENEQFLSLILERVSTGILLVDSRGIVQKVNRAALDLLGFPVFSHLRQLQIINESYPERFLALKAGDSLQITLPTDRHELQISVHVSSLKLKRGPMRIFTLNNIGNELEMKEMESWIHLIRVMTHEIMNSIAPITSLSQTMRLLYQSDDDADPKTFKQNTLEVFETISSTASGLLAFVESYRKFTSVPKPKMEPFDLRKLIEKILLLHEPDFVEKSITTLLQLPDTLPVVADENLIMQVLINLVKNAVEACDQGQIRISAPTPLSPDHLLLEIANSGQAIPPDILPHIFTPFFTTKPSGSGIGLSVSRYIMRLHGGKLQHTTTRDGMTAFQMELRMRN